MKIYRTSQTEEPVEMEEPVEIEVPSMDPDEPDEGEEILDEEVPEPVNIDMEWALSIIPDERAAAWLAALKSNNRLDGYDDEQIGQLLEEYGRQNNGNYYRLSFFHSMSDLARNVSGTKVESKSGIGTEIADNTVRIINDAIAQGWIGEDTAKRAVNPVAGIIPVGDLRETGFEKEVAGDKSMLRYKEVVDEGGNTFISIEFRGRKDHRDPWNKNQNYYEKDPNRVSIFAPDSEQLYGANVTMESSSYRWTLENPDGSTTKIEKDLWYVRAFSFMPTEKEKEVFSRIESALDNFFADEIKKYEEKSQDLFEEHMREYQQEPHGTIREPHPTINKENFNYSREVRRQNYHWRMDDDEVIKTKSQNFDTNKKRPTLLTFSYEGFGEVPNITEILSSAGDIGGVTISERKRKSGVLTEAWDKNYSELSFSISPEDEFSEEDYNETIDTLSRLNEDGSGIRLLDGLPENVQGMMKRGALGISDDREIYEDMVSIFPKLQFARAFIVAGFGNSKFRIMINPFKEKEYRLQAAAHELGHFIYYYMLSGQDYFADKREGNDVKKWNDWYATKGIKIKDRANNFVQTAGYGRDIWDSEYFAEVASAVLMVSGSLAGQIDNDEMPAISPESYSFAQELIQNAKIPQMHYGDSKFKKKNRMEMSEDEDVTSPDVLNVNDSMADYGGLFNIAPDRPKIESSSWLDRSIRMERFGLSASRGPTASSVMRSIRMIFKRHKTR